MGMDKAGLRGIGIIAIPLFANALGARVSTGVILPMLVVGDICSLIIYRGHVGFSYLKKMLPMAIIGLIAGMLLGNIVPDRIFLLILAIIVSICLVFMIWKEINGSDLKLPDNRLIHYGAGLLGGISSMLGNAPGPIMAAYLLALDLPKKIFIGTGAVFFFIVNVLKLPIHIFFWNTIKEDTLRLSLTLVPMVFVGIALGFALLNKIPDKLFRLLIILVTVFGTMRMFF